MNALAFRPARTFALQVRPSGSTAMAFATGYLDDSGTPTDPQHSACSIGGLLGTLDGWAEFETGWSAALSKFGIPYLHMKLFAHHLPPYAGLTEADRIAVLQTLTGLIKDCRLEAYGAVIRLPGLDRFNRERGRNLKAIPLALYACTNNIYVEDPWRTVELVLDNFDKPYSVLADATDYAGSHWSDDVTQNARFRTLGVGDSFRNVLPMQAADFVAYEIKKNVESRRDWMDAATDDDPDTWVESERQWLESRGFLYPRIRKSFAGLLDAVPAAIAIWDYNVFCDLDDRRGGIWSKDAGERRGMPPDAK